MNTIEKDYTYEFIEKKSIFIVSLKKVNSPDEAFEFINKIKEKYIDATHNVYAFRIINKNNEYIKYNDDGEPLNTAGKPCFEILNNLNINNVAVVVTRYFGGIKLGAGGLIRAYSKATKLAIIEANIIEEINYRTFIVFVDYSNNSILENYINKNNILIVEKSFNDKVNYKLKVPENNVNLFLELNYIEIVEI